MSLLSFLTVIGLRTVSWKRSTGPLLVVLLFHLQMHWTHAAWFGVASVNNFQVLHGSSYICTACQDKCFHSYIFEWGALSLWESTRSWQASAIHHLDVHIHGRVLFRESDHYRLFRLVLLREICNYRTGVLDWRLFVIPIAGSTVVETDHYYTTISYFLKVL